MSAHPSLICNILYKKAYPLMNKKIKIEDVTPYLNHCNDISGSACRITQLNLHHNISYQDKVLCFISSIVYGINRVDIMLVGKYLYDMYQLQYIYEYNTRITEYVRVPSVSPNPSKSSWRHQGIIIWISITNAGINPKVPVIASKLYASMPIRNRQTARQAQKNHF